MPPIEEGAGSSPAEDEIKSAPVEGQADVDPTPSDANAADSSVADTKDPDAKSERAAGLDLTLKALEQTPKAATDGEDTSTSGEKDGKASADQKAASEKDADKADDPDAKLPFHEHPRWQQVTKENATLKEENSSMKADVEQYRAIEAFRESHGLEVTEVSDGYKIMALVKNDPAAALPYLEGLVKDIKGVTGHTLPEDLQADVDAGGITEERALELSIARAKGNTTAAQQKEARERQEAERRTTRSEEHARAGQDWTEKVKQRDPEFSHKEQLVVDRIRAILSADPSRAPKTVDDVHKLSDEAYEHVNKTLGGITTRKATPPTASGVSATAVASPNAPKTGLDITRAALGMT